MRNQTSFRLTTTLLPTDMTAKTTQVINKVDENGDKFYPTFTEETIVLTNDDRTVMETARATASDWVLTFTKRGLSDDVSETQVANRKLTRNPWSLVFITAWAADYIDKDDSVTWTGNQTYTGTLTSTSCATYCGNATYKGMLTTEKWVKYPNFADVAALQAYDAPFAWMFATVDSTWELYRYNAFTCCWDMVSSVALGTYQIQVEDTAPAACTADTIITVVKPAWDIYVWNCDVVEKSYFADVLVVWWWGGYSTTNSYYAWGWWWGWVIECLYFPIKRNNAVTVWGCGAARTNWGNSSFSGLIALGGWWWGSGCLWASWGGGEYNYGGRWMGTMSQGFNWGTNLSSCSGNDHWAWGWWWGAWWAWGNAPSRCHWGDGGSGKYSIIMWCFYGAWWAGWSWCYTSPASPWYWWGNCWSGWSWCWGSGKVGVSCGTCWIVAVRYPTDWSYGIHCATWGDCVYTCDWYTIHCFVTNWTFCIVC